MNPTALPEFDPEKCGVLVDLTVRPLVPRFPEDALCYATAQVVPFDEEGEAIREQVYGTVEWTLVQYGAALNAGCPGEDVADVVADLYALHFALFDEDTDLPRDEFDLAGGQSDLVVIDELTVTEGQDYGQVASALLEHLLTHFTGGCFGVAYIDGGEARPEFRELLVERGFQRHQRRGWAFFLCDIGKLPPGEAERDPSAH